MPDTDAQLAYVMEWIRRRTFEGLIDDLERICERGRPAPNVSPVENSRAWFAQEILDTISTARDAQRAGRCDLAMDRAVAIGIFAAGARFLNWTSYREKQAARSQAGAVTKRDTAARRNEHFRVDVETMRRQHPGETHRQIARRLFKKYGRPGPYGRPRDPVKALNALTKRIRLNKK